MIYTCDSGSVLHERAASFAAAGSGWLSVKTFAGGAALYNAGGGTFAVDDGSFLVLNHGTSYSIAIDSATPVESCCVFWAPAAAADVYHALTMPVDTLLTDPKPYHDTPAFVERTFRSGDDVLSLVARIRAASAAGAVEPAWLDEQLQLMLGALLRLSHTVEHEIAALPYLRASTRLELYRRLHLARDYAEASLERPVRLAELAAVAGMSPNHLLRGFHHLFGCTPLQYMSERRISLACRLLRETDLPVAEICLAVGLQSFTSFSRLFLRRTGLSPSAYRKKSAVTRMNAANEFAADTHKPALAG